PPSPTATAMTIWPPSSRLSRKWPGSARRRTCSVSVRLDEWRGCPGAVGHLGPRRVQAHVWRERRVLRHRQPVRFLVRTRRLCLYVDVERAIGVERELVAVADGEAVDRVRDQESVLVVDGDGPEGVDRRQIALDRKSVV